MGLLRHLARDLVILGLALGGVYGLLWLLFYGPQAIARYWGS